METKIASMDEFVQELGEWYESDHKDFKTLFDAAVANVQPIPKGQDPDVVYDWKDKGIADLCQFFVDWYNWMPGVDNGLCWIQKFSWLYYENEDGLNFVTTEPGYTMTRQFVQLRGAYFDSPDSLPLVDRWIKQLGPLMKQFVVPPCGYQNYHAFVIRRFKGGPRRFAAA